MSGWEDENGDTVEFDTPVSVEGDERTTTKVYPVFRKQLTVQYYVNDEIYTTDVVEPADQDDYELLPSAPIPEPNKYFLHWSKTEDDSAGEYDIADLQDETGTLKLHAISEKMFKASFVTGENATATHALYANENRTLDEQPEEPTRKGYEFRHWSLTEGGDSVNVETYVFTEDTTFYAVWNPIEVSFSYEIYIQHLDDDGYDLLEVVEGKGITEDETPLPTSSSVAVSMPTAEGGRYSNRYTSDGQTINYTNVQTLDYFGFHLNEQKFVPADINGEGDTSVKVYYDRNVHSITVMRLNDTDAQEWYYINPNNWVATADTQKFRYGQDSADWFNNLNENYLYYADTEIGSYYTAAPQMQYEDILMYRTYSRGQKYELRFVEYDPAKFNEDINWYNLSGLQSTLGTMKEIRERSTFQSVRWFVRDYYGYEYRVFEPDDEIWDYMYSVNTTNWVDKTDHVNTTVGFEPRKGTMSSDGYASVDVTNPAWRDYMQANVNANRNYRGTPYYEYYGEQYAYVGFLFYTRKSYTIQYFSGNTELKKETYLYEADISNAGLGYEKEVTPHPSEDGRIFQGWYEDANLTVEHDYHHDPTMPAKNIVVYAKWEHPPHIVTFHPNQDDYSQTSTISEIPHGLTYENGEGTVPEPLQPENTNAFLGWYIKDNQGRYQPFDPATPIRDDNTHVYARWDYNALELKYDLNGGSGTAPTDDNAYTKDGYAQLVDISAGDDAAYDGKVFIGWSETKNGSSGILLPGELINMTTNKTVYAQWKDAPSQHTVKIKYDANGGADETDDSVTLVEDSKLLPKDQYKVRPNGETTAPNENTTAINFVRKGYIFVGWNTKANGSGVTLAEDDIINLTAEDQDTANILYAMWEEAPIPVHFTTDGHGTVNGKAADNQEVEKNGNPEEVTQEPNDGYTFVNWTADKDVTLDDGTSIPAGDPITDEQITKIVVTEELTLTAHYMENPVPVHFTTDGNGTVNGKEADDQIVEKNGNPEEVTQEANEGYTFKHWTADKDVTLDDGTSIPAGDPITDEQITKIVVTEELTLTANYEQNPVPVHFTTDGNGTVNGKDSDDQEVERDGNPEEVTQEPKDGYTFQHWTADKAVTLDDGTVIPAGNHITDEQITKIVVTEELTLTAHYKENPIPVHFTTDGNGTVNGKESDDQEVEKNGNPEEVTQEPKDGYTFVNWTADKDVTLDDGTSIPAGDPITDEQITKIVVTEELTLTANYKENPIPVHFTTDGNGTVNGKDSDDQEVERDGNPEEVTQEPKDGYTFQHWTADKAVTLDDGTVIPAGNHITDEQITKIVVTEELTLTAHYKENPIPVHFTTDGNGTVNGKESDNQDVKKNGNPEEVTQEPKDGYTFKHWTADKDVTLDDGISIPAGDPITDEQITKIVVTEELTLTANYKKKPVNEPPTLVVKDKTIKQGDNLDLTTLIVSAEDKEDGDLKRKVKIIDDGGFNKDKPGKYPVIFMVTDEDGNSVTKTAIVEVVGEASTTSDENGDKPTAKKDNQRANVNKYFKNAVSIPKTEDLTAVTPYVILLGLSLIVLVILGVKKRKAK